MAVRIFGSVDGRDVHAVTLATATGAEARVLTWGATLGDLVVPGPRGPQRVVLGFDDLDGYRVHSRYLGAVVGRYANRIGNARFSLGGRVHRLAPNWKERHQLHGGPVGFGQRLWTLVHHGPATAVLALVSDDGDMGYPGRLVATCTYALVEPATLRVAFEATADAPTPVNLTTHAYFNLDGAPDIGDHELMIAAGFVTPTDDDLIPTGEVRPVAGTDRDFRQGRPVGRATPGGRAPHDINYVLDRAGGDAALRHDLVLAATLISRTSGIQMELWTTEPGLQFYDGHLLDVPVAGLGGARYGRHGGLCLEPQRFPDGPNHAHFPSGLLEPGAVSRQASEFRFGTA